MTTLANPSRCQTCGGELRAGLCPPCTFRVALPREDEPAREETPLQVGDYELLEVIAHGGMGVVWRARQARLGRLVALKLLRESALPGEAPARRFRIEAEAIALLRHRHIVTIYEVGEIGGRYFFSMELLARSLADRLRDGPLPPRSAALLMAQIARGLAHAHDRGVLHRDLKPSNILLDGEGDPRISDFGLARLTESSDRHTLTGALLGTPAYMSPEAATSLHGEVTVASDVYGLGAIFYEALTGQPPFRAESQLQLLRRVAEETPMPPMRLAPGVPSDLQTICLQCLEKAPAARPRSAAALADDLDRWARGEPIHARRTSAAERLWKWARRHKARAALYLTAILAVFTVAAVSLAYSRQLSREVTHTLAAERNLTHRLAAQHSEAAARLVRGADPLRALPHLVEDLTLLSGDAAAERLVRLRFEAIVRAAPRVAQLWFPENADAQADFDAAAGRVAILDGTKARVFDAATGAPVTPPLVHLDWLSTGALLRRGTRLLTGTRDSRWTLWDATDGRRLAEGAGERSRTSAINGTLNRAVVPIQHFLVHFDRRVQSYVTETGAAEGEPFTFAKPVEDAIAHPDGTRYLIMAGDELHLLDAVTRRPIHPPIPLGKGADLRGLDREGKLAGFEAEAGKGARLVSVDLTTGSIVGEAPAPSSTLGQGWLGKRSRWSVLDRDDAGFTLRDVLSGHGLLFAAHGAQGHATSVAPAGESQDRFATAARDGSMRLWDLDGPISPTFRTAGRPSFLLLGAGGRQVVTGSGEPAIRLWEVPALGGGWAFAEKAAHLQGVFFSGSEIIACGSEGRIERWNPSLRQPAAPAVHWSEAVQSVHASADGRLALLCGAQVAQLWSIPEGAARGEQIALPGRIAFAALSGDGSTVALFPEKGDGLAGPPGRLAPIAALSAPLRTVVLSPDGRRLLIASLAEAQLWALPEGRQIATIRPGADCARWGAAGHEAVLLWSIGPKAAQIASGTRPHQEEDYLLRIFDGTTGAARLPALVQPNSVTDAAISPDGRTVLATNRDDARLWDATDGRLLRVFREHPLPVLSGGFSPDGTMVWTGSNAGLCLWETATGLLLAPPFPLRGYARVAWREDSLFLAGTDDKRRTTVWELTPSTRTLAEMRTLAARLSGYRADAEGALYPLTAAELRALAKP